MKIQIFSDLHLDAVHCEVPAVAPDVACVVVAGDTQQGAVDAIQTLRTTIPMTVPIVTVCGNHEFYRRCLPQELTAAKLEAPLHGVHLLENDSVIVGGVRFIGATLWTDYELYGEPRRTLAMTEAFNGMNDHRLISWTKKPWQRFRPREARMLHIRSRNFIEQELVKPFDGPSCIVTHHAPLMSSLDSRFGTMEINAAYASDLSELIQTRQPDFWIHGHVHRSWNYLAGRTGSSAIRTGMGRKPVLQPELA